MATDCDTFSKALQFIGGTISKKYPENTDCCLYQGITCDTQRNITQIKISEVLSTTGDMNNFFEELSNLKFLTYLELKGISTNFKKGLSNKIGNLTNLKTLIYAKNNLECLSTELPNEIGNLINLEKLDLSGNGFDGYIPKTIGNLKNLKYLDLSSNKFNGTIPYEFKNLENIKEIDLSDNSNLHGYIPQLSNVTACNYKDTDLCSLKGSECLSKYYCTVDEIEKTNESNGSPNQSLYKENGILNTSERNTGSTGSSGTFTNLDIGNGDFTLIIDGKFILIIIIAIAVFLLCFIKCCCCCCRNKRQNKMLSHIYPRSHSSINPLPHSSMDPLPLPHSSIHPLPNTRIRPIPFLISKLVTSISKRNNNNNNIDNNNNNNLNGEIPLTSSPSAPSAPSVPYPPPVNRGDSSYLPTFQESVSPINQPYNSSYIPSSIQPVNNSFDTDGPPPSYEQIDISSMPMPIPSAPQASFVQPINYPTQSSTPINYSEAPTTSRSYIDSSTDIKRNVEIIKSEDIKNENNKN